MLPTTTTKQKTEMMMEYIRQSHDSSQQATNSAVLGANGGVQ